MCCLSSSLIFVSFSYIVSRTISATAIFKHQSYQTIFQYCIYSRFSVLFSIRTSYVYDEYMKKHRNILDPSHPERPERISRIHEMLDDYGLLERCIKLPSRKATHKELALVHRYVIAKIPALYLT